MPTDGTRGKVAGVFALLLVGVAVGFAGVPGVDTFHDERRGPGAQVTAANASSETGQPIAPTDLFTVTNDGTIAEKYDLLNDSENRTRIVTAADQRPNESWSSAGAGALYTHTNESTGDETWYVSLRQRTPDHRGKSFELWTNDRGDVSDRDEWTQVWAENMTDNTESVEASILREYDGTWYFYFAWDRIQKSSSDWQVGYVTAESAAGLPPKLNDRSTWTNLSERLSTADTPHTEKDPYVMEWNDRYYLLTGEYESGRTIAHHLYVADTPAFRNVTKVGDPSKPIRNQWAGDDQMNVGTITYDERSQRFVYWTNVYNRSTNMTDWAWATSPDLETWTFAGARPVEPTEKYTNNSNAATRYFDYARAGVNNETGVVMMEWDHNDDDVAELHLWDYTENESERDR